MLTGHTGNELPLAAVDRSVDGLQALARSLVHFDLEVLAVPGAPATGLLSAIEGQGHAVVDCHDELTGARIAFGRSVAGQPTALVIKGNGSLLLADSLKNAMAHGCGAPLVLVVGDDPLSLSSTVPSDVRALAAAVECPLFEVLDVESAGDVVGAAIAASASGRPVIIRFTGALARMRGPAPLLAPPAPRSPRTLPDPMRVHQLTKRARWDFAVAGGADVVLAAAALAPMPRIGTTGPVGVIAVGGAWSVVHERAAARGVPMIGVSAVSPLPPAVVDFCTRHHAVVVVEEGQPFAERAIRNAVAVAGIPATVHGQDDGRVAPGGVEHPTDLDPALDGSPVTSPAISRWRDGRATQEHEFARVFDALRQVRLETGISVHGCVGSCIDGAYSPWWVLDTALDLGGATGVAHGVAEAGVRTIALIGDYGLNHSGLSGYDQIYQRDLPVLTIVLANGISRKTGGQVACTSPYTTDGRPLDLKRLLTRSAEDDQVAFVDLVTSSTRHLYEAISDALEDLPRTLVICSVEPPDLPDQPEQTRAG